MISKLNRFAIVPLGIFAMWALSERDYLTAIAFGLLVVGNVAFHWRTAK